MTPVQQVVQAGISPGMAHLPRVADLLQPSSTKLGSACPSITLTSSPTPPSIPFLSPMQISYALSFSKEQNSWLLYTRAACKHKQSMMIARYEWQMTSSSSSSSWCTDSSSSSSSHQETTDWRQIYSQQWTVHRRWAGGTCKAGSSTMGPTGTDVSQMRDAQRPSNLLIINYSTVSANSSWPPPGTRRHDHWHTRHQPGTAM